MPILSIVRQAQPLQQAGLCTFIQGQPPLSIMLLRKLKSTKSTSSTNASRTSLCPCRWRNYEHSSPTGCSHTNVLHSFGKGHLELIEMLPLRVAHAGLFILVLGQPPLSMCSICFWNVQWSSLTREKGQGNGSGTRDSDQEQGVKDRGQGTREQGAGTALLGGKPSNSSSIIQFPRWGTFPKWFMKMVNDSW